MARHVLTLIAVAVGFVLWTVGGAAAASPFDSQQTLGTATAVPNVFATPAFLLGEVDPAALGVSDTELANAGLAGASSSSSADSEGVLIVDDDGAQCPNAQFTSIQAAVDAADPGDNIKVCPGTYAEQVRITKDNLTLFSEQPLQAIIKAPSVMTAPNSIVLVDGAQGVTLRQFTVTGPFTVPGCVGPAETHTGIRIIGGGSATIYGNHITQIRDLNPALFGCQDGVGVLVGRQVLGEVGSALLRNNLIDRYQKGGVVIDNNGSSAWITQNAVVGDGLTSLIAQNGIQVGRGASAQVDHNIVSDNLFVRAGSFDTAAGILLFETSASVSADHNSVLRNGVGIDIDEGAVGLGISHNDVRDNQDDGIGAFAASGQNTIAYNKASNNAPVDCYDETTGSGTAGTANYWINDFGLTQNRPGLCKNTG